MDIIESLRPVERLRVMDLVAAVGIDVSDWASFKGGSERAASNPKYCYEWSYEDHDKKLIVVNLWHDHIETLEGEVVQSLNLRQVAERANSPNQSRRAIKMDFSLQKAARLDWPVRVIVCDGPPLEPGATRANADRRLLDSELWRVESYGTNGDCLLVRGLTQAKFIDQFDVEELPEDAATRKEAVTFSFERSPQVRRDVLERAKGQCELCGAKGFKTSAGSVYLESHHVQPLSEGGKDNIDNVVALCPNHHREAHYGIDAEKFKQSLFKCLERLNNAISVS